VRIFYLPAVELLDAPIPGLRGHGNDPRLKMIVKDPPNGFGHMFKMNSWSKRNGTDFIQSIRESGQLDPSICAFRSTTQKWTVEPGQTRWLALYHIGFPTQKLIVCVEDEYQENFDKHFQKYEKRELTSMSQIEELFTDPIANDLKHGGSLAVLKGRYKSFFEAWK
jgi:hypothetical protein